MMFQTKMAQKNYVKIQGKGFQREGPASAKLRTSLTAEYIGNKCG